MGESRLKSGEARYCISRGSFPAFLAGGENGVVLSVVSQSDALVCSHSHLASRYHQMLEILLHAHVKPQHLAPYVTSSKSHERFPLYLNQFVDPKSSIQLGQLRLVFAAEEGDELLEQRFLVVPTLRRGGRTQELV